MHRPGRRSMDVRWTLTGSCAGRKRSPAPGQCFHASKSSKASTTM
uniref:Uncharacterized protein n=1 Tax=Anopheles atroparvus TaxID=41427 RepID=A0A182JCE7_ANOAO